MLKLQTKDSTKKKVKRRSYRVARGNRIWNISSLI